MEYQVTFGSLVKENGFWNTDGMRAEQTESFDNLAEAKAFFDSYDVEDDFRTEWSTATVKPKNSGCYTEITKVVDDDSSEVIEWKQFTADDIA